MVNLTTSIHWHDSLHHDGSARYVSNPYPAFGETITVKLRVAADAPVQAVYLRTEPDGEQYFAEMTAAEKSEKGLRWWQGNLHITEPMVHYRFVIVTRTGEVWHYGAMGLTNYEPLDRADFQILADYHAPAWLFDAVFYQIFPDTFRNGDPSNDPKPEDFEYRGRRPHTIRWGEALPHGMMYGQTYYGGDLQGITQSLDYLMELGVTALYLTPIFKAYSCHRYDVADYDAVDPSLGGESALLRLAEGLAARGMRYIFDMVPNHCGPKHYWFETATTQPDSLERDFFIFHHYPDDYMGWLGYKSLVKLNFTSQELRRRMYGMENAPFRRWLRPPFSVDGWRVDVGNMLGRAGKHQLNGEVLREMRQAIKETNPDAYFMGENFHDATPQLQGDQWDGVMNYRGFTKPLKDWLLGYNRGSFGLNKPIQSASPTTTDAMCGAMQTQLGVIPYAVALQQFNMIGSHDVPRLYSLLHHNENLLRLAVILQMTFPGVPCVYYGDEIGMRDRPGIEPSRDCMIWDESRWNHDRLDFYRQLIRLRRQNVTLQRGGFQVVAVEADLLAYQREDAHRNVIVIAQRSQNPRPAGGMTVWHGGIADGTCFVEHFSGQVAMVENGQLMLPSLGQGGTIWMRKD